MVFDGECLVCNRGMRYIAERDPGARFRFATLQSPVGQGLALRAGVATEGKGATMLLLDSGKLYTRSEAVLRIGCALGRGRFERGVFRGLCTLGLWAPRWLRDAVYALVARNRLRLGSTTEACWLPSDDIRRRIVA